MPPPHTPPTAQYVFILMTERGRHYLLYDFGTTNASPPPPTTPQYLTILMTEREGAPLFFSDFDAPQCPPPLPDATKLNNLNDREGAPLCL